MLKFNTLLKENNIDPITVQLVRHQQTGPTSLTPYVLLRTDPERFEAYQRLQGRQIFNRDFMAAFVVTPTAETLFANLYRVSQPIRNHFAINCPISLKEFEPGTLMPLKHAQSGT